MVRMYAHLTIITVLCSGFLLLSCSKDGSREMTRTESFIGPAAVAQMIDTLIAMHGDGQRSRIERGVRQVAERWREADGGEPDFQLFCREQFITDQDILDKTFARFEQNLMLIGGYFTELRRDLNAPLHLDSGPQLPVDLRFGEFSPGIHMNDDMFSTKLAFSALLNFPLTTLEQRLREGATWTRRQWAEARLAQRFDMRVPASAQQVATSAYTTADNYISNYNLHMHHVLDASGERLFPKDLVLISHWGLRDELKAQYASADGLRRQHVIMRVMERIIAQDIPAAVINNPHYDWFVEDNTIIPFGKEGGTAAASEREPDTRYEMWQKTFKGEQAIDTWTPSAPTHIARRFNLDREIPEEKVEELLVSILSDPLIAEVAELISARLGRPLQPFDIWYPGFKAKPPLSEAELDRIVTSRYPNTEAFEKDIPSILKKLGFDPAMVRFLADRIAVEASRGAGHAMPPGRLTDKARLRTRVAASGMNYKGYNIAIHELGHNVEQVLSFQNIDHTLLRGVPNTAFTEGFAFVFQSRDLELLGLRMQDPLAEASSALDVLWSTFEIAGVALVDMRAWRWLYEHPNATPAAFRDAVMDIAREVWNHYYAPVIGHKDTPLLAIYSHMVDAGLYTPDYPLGHIIAFQIEQYLKGKDLAKEMQRMCAVGSVSPELWMHTAVGAPISTKPLLEAARGALRQIQNASAKKQ
jgi:hypothetical protein